MYPTLKRRRKNNKKTLRGGAAYGNTRVPRNGELLGRFRADDRVINGNDLARIMNRESFPQIEALIKSLHTSIESLRTRVEALEAPSPEASPIGEDDPV